MHLVTSDEQGKTSEAPEVVRLTVPADPRYLSAVRLVAAALATDLDFTVDDIEELRMAVDEAAAVLISNASDGSSIRLAFTITRAAPAFLGVDGSIDGGLSTDAVDPLARRIVAAVVDRCTLNAGGFSLEKSSSLTRA
jgi:serine/threonine-protein kinase RsbW